MRNEYVALECKDCKHIGLYINERSDGNRCAKCNSGIYTPIDIGSKADLELKWLRVVRLEPLGKESKEAPKILYKCDRRACEKCDPECEYIKDIRHAKSYELKSDVFVEK